MCIYPNVTVKIYRTEKMEQPVESIEVDGKGNFYTTTPVDWGPAYRFQSPATVNTVKFLKLLRTVHAITVIKGKSEFLSTEEIVAPLH